MKPLLTAIFLCSLLFPVALGAQRLPETIIKVGIVIDARSVNLSCEQSYYLYEMNTGEKTDIEPLNDYLVRGKGGSIIFNGKEFASPVRLVANVSDAHIRINGRRYRDNVMITAEKGKLTAINELGIDGYLFGILPAEASPEWSLETLKAQAVISRTYALRNLRRHGKDGFDICTQTHCQVYGGLESEDERSNRAVEETKGEVLVYKGELAQTLFHASCGGHTENPNNVWNWENEPPEYLEGRSDKFCKVSPHNDWKNRISADVIRARLSRAGYRVGAIKKIKISGEDGSGRAKFLKIYSRSGTTLVPASKFRMAVDTWLVKSTMFNDITRRGDDFEFSGRGWGHGVGLCQWGAKVMGDEGFDYREILRFYYPGADVEKWDD